MGQQMTLAVSMAQRLNYPTDPKKPQNQVEPIDTKKIPNLEKFAQKISLKDDHEIIGVFKKMGVDADGRYVCFEEDNALFFISFKKGTKAEEILGKAFRCVKPNRRIRIRKFDSPDTPLTIEKITNFKSIFPSARIITLVTGEAIIGSYLELQKDFDDIHLILKLIDSQKIVKLSFLNKSIEARIIKLALSKVKHKVKLRIVKTSNESEPIAIRRLRNTSTKGNSLHLDIPRLKIIERYSDRTVLKPRKRWLAAISTMDEIIKNKHFIVAVILDGKVKCNKMLKTGDIKSFCSHVGTAVNSAYCLDHCLSEQISKTREGGL